MKNHSTELQKTSESKTTMETSDVIGIVRLLESEDIDVWLDGGWGVDALLGEQARPHEDVDIVIQHKDVPKLRELLAEQDYKDVRRNDTSAWNFVLGDDQGHLVDVHAITFDAKGNGLYGPVEKGVMYPAGSLTGIGVVGGQTMKCVSAEYMVKFHMGYKLDENDFKDVSALCARFGIDYPEEYKLWIIDHKFVKIGREDL